MDKEIFVHYEREEWKGFRTDIGNFEPIKDLAELVSLNDRLSQDDVRDVYVPLVNYIDVLIRHMNQYHSEKDLFFGGKEANEHEHLNNPFVIGISGSVAVGKSTTARVLQTLLSEYYGDFKVDLVTTDGFLYPNEVLENMGKMHRKGFPDSYDMNSLIEFMRKVKTGQPNVSHPIYSHDIYNIIPDKVGVVDRPDILIVEGINTLQLPENQEIYMTDFFDFSIYIDADPFNIKKWFNDRFSMHMELAKDDPSSYYYELTKLSPERVKDYGERVWYTVNLTNLVQYIAPTKVKANVILHKSHDHTIDDIFVRKY